MTIVNCDIHKLPFDDGSFDTVVDTFGLECCYDVDKAYKEMKRLCKKGGKILLLERGQSLWLTDNFKMLRKASINLGARGQVYHHDFAGLIENDPEIKVLQKKRKKKGMIYFYVLQKVWLLLNLITSNKESYFNLNIYLLIYPMEDSNITPT